MTNERYLNEEHEVLRIESFHWSREETLAHFLAEIHPLYLASPSTDVLRASSPFPVRHFAVSIKTPSCEQLPNVLLKYGIYFPNRRQNILCVIQISALQEFLLLKKYNLKCILLRQR